MKTVFTNVLLFLTLAITAQKTYLKIVPDNNIKNTVSYPPGTKFELRNEHNYIILKYSETPRVYEIDGDYKLIVFPTYKNKSDVYKLKEGAKVILKLSKDFRKPEHENTFYINKDAVTSEKKVTNSTINEGKKNLVFKLSNGIKFEYKDGKYFATYYDKYVDIVGKYVIKTKIGTLKLSFNPTNGETWWVFEKPKK